MVVRARRGCRGSARPWARRALSVCVHSQRELVSNDTQLMQLCRSTPQRAQRPSASTGSARRLPQRAQRKTSCDPSGSASSAPTASCSRLPGPRRSPGGPAGFFARPPVPRLVLIAALTVFPVAHLCIVQQSTRTRNEESSSARGSSTGLGVLGCLCRNVRAMPPGTAGGGTHRRAANLGPAGPCRWGCGATPSPTDGLDQGIGGPVD